MSKFEINKNYFMRSVCDYDCIWEYKVVERTEKTVTLVQQRTHVNVGKRIVKRVALWEGIETVSPLGKYSMSPILSADKVAA